MYRKKSLKSQSRNSSLGSAKKIYISNKSISHKNTQRSIKRNRICSVNDLKTCKITSQPTLRPKASSQFMKQQLRIQNTALRLKYINIPKPITKNKHKQIECQSTAQDLIQKINNKILHYRPQQPKPINDIALKYRKKNISKEIQLQTITSQNIPPQSAQRKIFQCKIIKSIKIPFPLVNKSAQRKRKFQSLVADTDQISQIMIHNTNDIVSPESQFMIQF